jgi:NADH:ubiquinone oxidoreductase subunit 4 (subunit M)
MSVAILHMDAFGGLWKIMPVYAVFADCDPSPWVCRVSMDLHEFTILLVPGAPGRQAPLGSVWSVGLSAIGVILAAGYMLFMFR